MVTSPETDKSLCRAAIGAAAAIRPHESEIIEPLVDFCDEDIAEAAMNARTEAGFSADLASEDLAHSEDDQDLDKRKKVRNLSYLASSGIMKQCF